MFWGFFGMDLLSRKVPPEILDFFRSLVREHQTVIGYRKIHQPVAVPSSVWYFLRPCYKTTP